MDKSELEKESNERLVKVIIEAIEFDIKEGL